MRGDVLDWHERGDFIQLGSSSPGQMELYIGSDDGRAAVELSPAAWSALAHALADDEGDAIESAVDAAMEDLRGELEDVTEERDRLADEVKQLKELLAEARDAWARVVRETAKP